jgi:hypothetical protein
MADPNVLRQEQEAFERQLDALLTDHEGQYVVFQGGKVVAFFDDHESAYAAALDRFGPDATFVVAQIRKSPPQPVSVAWDAGVMFG